MDNLPLGVKTGELACFSDQIVVDDDVSSAHQLNHTPYRLEMVYGAWFDWFMP